MHHAHRGSHVNEIRKGDNKDNEQIMTSHEALVTGDMDSLCRSKSNETSLSMNDDTTTEDSGGLNGFV